MLLLSFNPIMLWVAVILISVLLEAVTLSLSAIWFTVGGLAALVAASIGFGFGSQLTVFTLFSAALLVLVRPLCRRFLRPKGAATNADRVIGQTVVVTETIDNMQGSGAVKVFGQIWTARSVGGESCPVGALVRIKAIEGVKVIVERADQPEENG